MERVHKKCQILICSKTFSLPFYQMDNLKLIQELTEALANTLRSRHVLESGLEMPEPLIQQCVTDITTILTEITSRMNKVDSCRIVRSGAMNHDLREFINIIDSTYTSSPSHAIKYFRTYLQYLFHQISICLCTNTGFGEYHDPLVQAIYEAFPKMPELDEYDRKYNCKVIKKYLHKSTADDLFFCGDIERIAEATD